MAVRSLTASVLVFGLAAFHDAAAQQARGDSLAVNETEYQGWKLYHVNCDRCHGVDALGSSFAPNLRRSVGPDGGVNHDLFVAKTENGVPDKGMPAWKGNLTREQIDALWAYITARSSGRLAPGRPHVKSPIEGQ